MTPTNITFTHGESDPSRAYGMNSEKDIALKRETLQDIPACDNPPSSMKVFRLVWPGASHVEDVRKAWWDGGVAGLQPLPVDEGVAAQACS